MYIFSYSLNLQNNVWSTNNANLTHVVYYLYIHNEQHVARPVLLFRDAYNVLKPLMFETNDCTEETEVSAHNKMI